MLATVSATWTRTTGSQCVATGSGGHSIVMLAALLGCTGVDFTNILGKQRQAVTRISAEVHGEQDQYPPWLFRRIEMVFTVEGRNLDDRAVERALSLAVERYCSVGVTLAGTAEVSHPAIVGSTLPVTA
jgi:putative redox protein